MKKHVYRYEVRGLRIPNFMHLDACIQGCELSNRIEKINSEKLS